MLGIFLDIETTGLNPSQHRVLEIAFKIIDLASGEVQAEYEQMIAQPDAVWAASDPQSLQINGFSIEKTRAGKSEEEVARNIVALFEQFSLKRGKAAFICQNPSFDRSFFSQLIDVYTQERLQWPYHWLDFASMFWGLYVHEGKLAEGGSSNRVTLSKDQIARRFGLPPEEHPHRAMNGVNHLLLCYEKVVGFSQQRAIT